MQAPERHASYAAKVLLKYKLLEWQSINLQALHAWIEDTPYFDTLHQSYFASQMAQQWRDSLIESLIASGAAQLQRNAAGESVLFNQ